MPDTIEGLVARFAEARREIQEVRGAVDALVVTLQGVIGTLDGETPGAADRLHDLLSHARQETRSDPWPDESPARTRAREQLRSSLLTYIRMVADRPSTDLRSSFSARCQRLVADIEPVLGFRPRVFDGKDAVAVAGGLVLGKTSGVFRQLQEKRRLDLTIEHIIVNEPEWLPLFEDVHRSAANARLAGQGP